MIKIMVYMAYKSLWCLKVYILIELKSRLEDSKIAGYVKFKKKLIYIIIITNKMIRAKIIVQILRKNPIPLDRYPSL